MAFRTLALSLVISVCLPAGTLAQPRRAPGPVDSVIYTGPCVFWVLKADRIQSVLGPKWQELQEKLHKANPYLKYGNDKQGRKELILEPGKALWIPEGMTATSNGAMPREK